MIGFGGGCGGGCGGVVPKKNGKERLPFFFFFLPLSLRFPFARYRQFSAFFPAVSRLCSANCLGNLPLWNQKCFNEGKERRTCKLRVRIFQGQSDPETFSVFRTNKTNISVLLGNRYTMFYTAICRPPELYCEYCEFPAVYINRLTVYSCKVTQAYSDFFPSMPVSLSRIIYHSHLFTRLEIYHHIYFIFHTFDI